MSRPSPKITEKDIIVIVARFIAGESQSAIAQEYGITQNNISRIVRGDAWRHVERDTVRCEAPVFTYAGETLRASEWAKRTGIPHMTINHRVRSGWPIEKILTVPVGKCPRGRHGWTYKPKDLREALK